MTDSSPPPSPPPNRLATSYGKSRLTVLAVNPYLVYAYWDFDASALPCPPPPAILRFHDVTPDFPGASFDVAVDLEARSWYVPVWSPARTYSVDLGWSEEDQFHPLAKSNQVETPRAWPVTQVEPFLTSAPAAPPPDGRAAAETEATATPPRSQSEALSEPPEFPRLPDALSPLEDLQPPLAFLSPMNAAEVLQRRLEDFRPEPATRPSAAATVESPRQVAVIVSPEPVHLPATATPAPEVIASPPLAVEPAPVPPPDAALVLRRKLEEIYSIQGVEPLPIAVPKADAPAAAAEKIPAPAALRTPRPAPARLTASGPVLPGAPGDLTVFSEERFSPGVSSARAGARSGEPKA